jgi:hypothetical protein
VGAEFAVALSADGKWAFTGGLDRTAVRWDAQTGKQSQTFTGHTASLRCLALSPDGRRLVTGSEDKTAILWDAAAGDALQTFKGHADGVTCVALSTDGKQAHTASQDRTAVLWDAQGGEKLRTFTGHSDAVTAVAWSTDGKRVVTGSLDGTTRLWDAATGEELCRLISLDGGDDWLVVTPEGLFDGSVNAPRFVSYRVAGTLDFVPLDRYVKRYHTPGLLGKIRNGGRPTPRVDVGKALPPRVRLVSPTAALEVTDGRLEVKTEAESAGDLPVTPTTTASSPRPCWRGWRARKLRFKTARRRASSGRCRTRTAPSSFTNWRAFCTTGSRT